MNRLLHDKKIILIYSIFVLLFGILGISLEVARALYDDNFGASLFVTFLYFTTQSNLLLTVTLLLFLLKKRHKKSLNYLAFITLVNIVITAVVFHILLVPYMEKIGFIHHVLHTVNPILYVLFYYIIYDQKLPLNKFWIALIYPLVFMASVYIFIEPFFGDLIENTIPDFASARYVYPFLDPKNYKRETLGLLAFNLGLLAPIFTLFSYLLLYFKQKIYLKIHNIKYDIKKV